MTFWLVPVAALIMFCALLWARIDRLRDLVRRCAEHLGSECHTGIRDIDTHRALWAECEREGWDEKGGERSGER